MGKREAIIQSAIHLFQQNGIEQTTVSQIVQSANIAQGTFYLYFPSKLSLMPAIAEEMVKIMMNSIKEDIHETDDIKQQLKTIVHCIFKVNQSYSEVLAMIYSGLAATEHLKEWEAVYEPVYNWMSHLLEEAKSANEIDEMIKPERTAKLIIGLIESAAEQVYLYDYPDEAEAKIQKEEVIRFLFRAIGLR